VALLAVTIWQVFQTGIVMLPEMTAEQISVSITTGEDMERSESYRTADEVMDRILRLEGVSMVGILDGGSSGSMLGGMTGGTDLATLSIKERADHIGYVMQNPNQMISKTQIFDEVALGLRNRGIAEEEIRARVEETLKICGLYPFRNWPVSALSYGQKKRVTIASILVLRPEMILLDEPTAGQDLKHYTEIMEFLSELNRQGVTVVLITHDMHLMLEYTPRAIVFNEGRVIADKSAAEVLNSPEIVEAAHLKETSLYHLAMECGIAESEEFTRRFVRQDREVR
jgi:energy-coupling factor transport system ATP-binding protein